MNAWKSVTTTLDVGSFDQLVQGREDQPHDFLGPHLVEGPNKSGTVLVRAFLPVATEAWIENQSKEVIVARPMKRVHDAGVFEIVCDSDVFETARGKYKFRYVEGETTMTEYDPYAFPPYLSDEDLYLFNEGNHYQIYEKLGAHVREIDGVTGVNFAVWAPNAKSISLVGNFNDWDGRRHPMRKRMPSGIWELFLPELEPGEIYKFRVTDCFGQQIEKSDPFGFYSELPPRTASVVSNLDGYQWQDESWMSKRESQNQLEQPISVYELHLGSWRTDEGKHNGWMNYRDIAHQLVEYCRELEVTHIELMPISEHPYTGSWGYQTVGYFACTSRYGTPEDFMYFVDYCHQNDLGVKALPQLGDRDGMPIYDNATTSAFCFSFQYRKLMNQFTPGTHKCNFIVICFLQIDGR